MYWLRHVGKCGNLTFTFLVLCVALTHMSMLMDYEYYCDQDKMEAAGFDNSKFSCMGGLLIWTEEDTLKDNNGPKVLSFAQKVTMNSAKNMADPASKIYIVP